jgi:hypothetical protein
VRTALKAAPSATTNTAQITQSNTDVTQEFALAFNLDSPDDITVVSNSVSTHQNNQIGISPTQLHRTPTDILQSNSNETVQIAIAVNDRSAGATAIASNINFTEQVNLIALLGTDAVEMDDGSIVRINTNTTLQFDLAVNLDSPGALAKATSTNTTLQANRGPFIGGHASGSNDTVQISLALDIESPGALAVAAGRNATVQIGGGHGGVMKDISLTHGDLPFGGIHHNSAGESAVTAQILAGIGGLSFLPSADADQIMAALLT